LNKDFFKYFGFDLLGCFSECGAKKDGILVIDNPEVLEGLLVEIAETNRLVPVSSSSEKFIPQGASALVCIAEDESQKPKVIANIGLETSHLAAHSWPESGILQVSLYTCDKNTDGRKVMFDIWDEVGARELVYRRIHRDGYFSADYVRRFELDEKGRKVCAKRRI